MLKLDDDYSLMVQAVQMGKYWLLTNVTNSTLYISFSYELLHAREPLYSNSAVIA